MTEQVLRGCLSAQIIDMSESCREDNDDTDDQDTDLYEVSPDNGCDATERGRR